MPRPIQPSAFSYLLPTLVQSGVNSQSSGASGWTPGGALSLQIPDNTIIGGNPRGLGAVDLQTQRTAATQVASGTGSFVVGVNSTASGSGSTATGSSTASGLYSTATGASTASGQNSTATGASSAGGQYAAAFGQSNASGQHNFAGGAGNVTAGQYGVAFGNGSVSAEGNCFAIGNSSALSYTNCSLGSSTASSNWWAFAGGQSTATGQHAFAGGNATASGLKSAAFGGATASSTGAFAAGFNSNASATNSVAFGGSKSDRQGKFAFTGSTFGASAGDNQTGIMVLKAATSDATPTALTSDNGAAGTNNQAVLPDNSAFTFSILVVGRQQAAGGTASAAWEIKGLIRRESGVGTTTLVNSATTVIDNTPGWAVAVSADTTNGALRVTGTGAAATNIRWLATVYTSEITYA